VLDVERGGEHFRENAGAGCGNREVGVKARVIPVRQAGDDELAEIGEDCFHGFRVLRAVRGETIDECAGFDVRQDRVIPQIAKVVGHPVDHFVRGGAEFFRGHSMIVA
jgi:hypothetical protein